MRYLRSQDVLERSRMWKKLDVSRYAGTGVRTVRSKSEERGGMCLPCPVTQGGA
jgi:hypothetical protein